MACTATARPAARRRSRKEIQLGQALANDCLVNQRNRVGQRERQPPALAEPAAATTKAAAPASTASGPAVGSSAPATLLARPAELVDQRLRWRGGFERFGEIKPDSDDLT